MTMATMLGIALVAVYCAFAVLAVRAVVRAMARERRSRVPGRDGSAGPRTPSGA